ncbi:Uncharacterized protein FWK35_00014246 [Aphis craccivora]|uniref:Uncharacterized protein n=1 Tax=Aphis craccivora TaxID=307492 RepID=A0A6G0Y4U2_APHCR|nr:Uncharacterized protein FWK35_00014246 [Aphis craccivora]
MTEKGVKEFCFYSDNCGEYAAFTLKIKITHRFLEKGHTKNEGDSMHACIKNAQKGKTIYVPLKINQLCESYWKTVHSD